jgi:DNA-binding CsgD family transcriptional regulator/tetratricopeptide (TPR) repeat protein
VAATSTSAFVGREAELARLAAALEEAGQGAAPAIVVEGESGAGKTRLLREFARLAAERGAKVLFGRCVDCGDAGPPYWPIIEALRPLFGSDDGGERPGDDRSRYFEDVLDLLEEAGRHSPVVLLLDDLHWADRSTRDLLGFLLANLAGGPGPLVLAAVGSEALVPGHPLLPLLAELRRSRRAEFLALDRLDKGDVEAQLTSMLGEAPEPDLLEEIWRRSEGNPFFVEELLAAARLSSGGHPPTPGGHELTSTLQPILAARLGALSPDARAAAGAVAAAVGPVSHRILAEVAGMPEEALLAGLRECVDHHVLLATRGSRSGTYTFRHSLLREAAYDGLLPGEATRLHAAYGRALAAEVADAAGSTVADLAAIAWHLYAAGDAERALPAALAAAEAAEAACGYSEVHIQYERALELAGRLPATGDGPDRTALAERAAEAAHLAGEPARAAELLDLALAGAAQEDLSRLLLALGRGRWAAGDSDGALAAYDEAVRRLENPETAEGVRALAAAAEARMLAGRYGESRRLAEDGLALARRLELPQEEAEILGTLGVDLALLGDADAAVSALDEAVEAAEKAGRPRPLARAWLNRAEVLAGPLNRLGDAAAVAAAGLDRLRRLGLGRSYGAALAATLANTLFRSGRWNDADPVIAAALADRPTGTAAIDLLLARCRLAVGRGEFAAAHADLERVDHRWAQAVAPRYQAPLLTLAAGLALWEGRLGAAREAVVRALDLVAGSDDFWLVAPVLWHGVRADADRAERARALGDRVEAKAAGDAAADFLEQARALQAGAAPAVRPVVAAYETLCRAEERRAGGAGDPEAWADAAERWAALDQPYPSAYARFREAEAVLAGQARSARAGQALRAAHDVAVGLGAGPLRHEIEALAGRARLVLARPEEPVPANGERDRPAVAAGPEPRPGPLDALTARELDVLALMAEGRTNREIGAALYISEKTASVHVSHILAKLGVRSRVQAVAVAHQVGVPRR